MMKALASGWALLCLMMFSGCSATPPIVRTVTIEVPRPVEIPPQIIGRCDPPPYPIGGTDNGDHTGYISRLLAVISNCDSQWQRLELFLNEQRKPVPKQGAHDE